MDTSKKTQKIIKLFFSKESLFFLIALFIFIALKYGSAQIRISDTNIYFYTARALFEGRLLYKDVFFTNLPLFPYVSLLYGIFTNWNLHAFYATPILEICVTAFFIFLCAQKVSKNPYHIAATVILYLFSFTIMATSDHQTGVFSASLFAVIGYYFALQKKPILSGVFFGLSVLTKAYFIPIPLAFILALFFENKKELYKTLFGFLTTTTVIFAFFFLLSGGAIISDIFLYSLIREQGLSKFGIFRFFIFKEIILSILFFINFSRIGKKDFFGFFSFVSVLFLLFYRDIYFLYLNFLIPFLALSSIYWLEKFSHKKDLQIAFFAGLLILSTLSINSYLTSYKDLQTIPQIKDITQTIKNLHPSSLYGINSITPALSYLTGIPLFDGIIDTNENRFRSKNLDASILTKKAITNGALLVTKSAIYPQYQINEIFMSEIFNTPQLKNCELILSEPVRFEGTENALSLVFCK